MPFTRRKKPKTKCYFIERITKELHKTVDINSPNNSKIKSRKIDKSQEIDKLRYRSWSSPGFSGREMVTS